MKNKGVGSQTSLLRGQGGYLNLKHNDDGKGYGGAYSGLQVFIVGKGTEEERVFTQDQLAEASAYGREVNRILISQTASNLPNLAMRLLFDEELIDA